VYSTTTRTAETAKVDRGGTAGKIGKHKTMPPHLPLTVGTRARLAPGK